MGTEANRGSRPPLPERIGRYRVFDRVGKGSMGVVYAAHDDAMGRDVAVKVMMADLEGEPEIRTRFLREAQIAAKLAHRNIVTIFDVDEDSDRLFIVMELLRGQTLSQCLRQRILPLEEKVDLIVQVCEGLAVASAAGVCHRDIKPSNLFVQDDGRVKILDFGIARLASSSMTASGYILGTPDYMSPEQARGIEVDERSDIFSVGAVLYLLLAGHKPFAAPDLPAVLHKVVSQDPPPLNATEAPGELASIVNRTLAKEPAGRYQHFRDLSSDLARWRRRYSDETSAIAAAALKKYQALEQLARQERDIAQTLSIEPEADSDGWLSEVAAGHPVLLEKGIEALRTVTWQRAALDTVNRAIDALIARWEPHVARLREASADFRAASSLFDSGDPRAALLRYEAVLRRVPNAQVDLHAERCRHLIVEQQRARNGGVSPAAGDEQATRQPASGRVRLREVSDVGVRSTKAPDAVSPARIGAPEVKENESARRARALHEALTNARSALHGGDAVRARILAHEALQLDPGSHDARQLLDTIAAAEGLADDDTVDLLTPAVDPDDTAKIVTETVWTRPQTARQAGTPPGSGVRTRVFGSGWLEEYAALAPI